MCLLIFHPIIQEKESFKFVCVVLTCGYMCKQLNAASTA